MLLILILFQTAGTLLLYIFLVNSNADHIRNIIFKDEKKLISLKFSKNDISSGAMKLNFKHTKEFSFNGNMYDIKNKHETSDSITYVCYQDKREDELNGSLKSNQNHQKSENQGNLEKLFNLLSANYLTETKSDENSSFKINSEINISQFDLLMVFIDDPSPPPKHIL